MRIILIFILFIIFLSCEKNDDDFLYTYKIARVFLKSDDFIFDSTVFYYNESDELIKIEKDNTPIDDGLSVSYPKYNNQIISYNSSQYFVGVNGLVDSITSKESTRIYKYNGDKLISEKLIENNNITYEHFLYYKDGLLIKDSTVYNNQFITVYEHKSTNVLTPHYIVDASGFRIFSMQSDYLKKESVSSDNNKTIHTYEIQDNHLYDYIKTIDTFYRDTVDLGVYKYYYLK